MSLNSQLGASQLAASELAANQKLSVFSATLSFIGASPRSIFKVFIAVLFRLGDSFIVPAGKKWEYKVTIGEIAKVQSSYTFFNERCKLCLA